MKNLNVPYSCIYSAFISNIKMDTNTLYKRVEELQKRLASLNQMELDGKTKYTGEDLNLLDEITNRLCEDNLKESDILEIERMMFKFI